LYVPIDSGATGPFQKLACNSISRVKLRRRQSAVPTTEPSGPRSSKTRSSGSTSSATQPAARIRGAPGSTIVHSVIITAAGFGAAGSPSRRAKDSPPFPEPFEGSVQTGSMNRVPPASVGATADGTRLPAEPVPSRPVRAPSTVVGPLVSAQRTARSVATSASPFSRGAKSTTARKPAPERSSLPSAAVVLARRSVRCSTVALILNPSAPVSQTRSLGGLSVAATLLPYTQPVSSYLVGPIQRAPASVATRVPKSTGFPAAAFFGAAFFAAGLAGAFAGAGLAALRALSYRRNTPRSNGVCLATRRALRFSRVTVVMGGKSTTR
jgi:hypothetical protein